MEICKHCKISITSVPGKVSKQFCSDKCRKASKRADLRENEPPGSSRMDDLPTPDTIAPQPRTDTTADKGKKQTFHDLPTDVQASIEQHCAENNDGERAASHSRATMTERALAYQKLFEGVL